MKPSNLQSMRKMGEKMILVFFRDFHQDVYWSVENEKGRHCRLLSNTREKQEWNGNDNDRENEREKKKQQK